MIRRLLSVLAAVCLLCAAPAALCEAEPDEQSITLVDADNRAVDTPEDEERQEPYVVSDVKSDEGEVIIIEGERPDFVALLLDVARAELGYEEGENNLSKYGEWSGDPNAAWCAEFVCWCVNQVDEAYGTKLLDKVYPNYSGQNTGRDWFIRRGRMVYRKGNCPDWGYQWLRGADDRMYKNDYIPRSGDLVFFSYNEAGDTEHVALVEYCARDSEGNVVVHVIEGNNPSAVARNSYMLDNSQILGFGACEDVIGTTMRVGNQGDKVLWLQQSLNALGFLDKRHLTGGYGGNTRRAVVDFQRDWMHIDEPNGIADRQTQQAIEIAINETVNNAPESWLVDD